MTRPVIQSNAKNEVTLAIDALSYGPYGIGRMDRKAVMVPNTAPGDEIIARVLESKDRYAKGELVRIIVPGPTRQHPPCPYVPECGGCQWQHLTYEAQLKAKEQNVENALRRIGKLADFELRPILASPHEYHYRRRIRLHCDGRKRLGFFGSSSHRLVEIERCLIADNRLNALIDEIREGVYKLSTAIEYVDLVAGDQSSEINVVLGATDAFVPADEALCAQLVGGNDAIHGIIAHGPGWRKVWKRPWLTAQLQPGLEMNVDADVFTQVNAPGNELLIGELLRSAMFTKTDRVLELFCGAGNFTLPIARQAKSVTAVDGYRPAVANGRLNADRLCLENIQWVCAPVPSALAQLQRKRERFTKIVLDPPRAGAKGLESILAAFSAQRILYISCNPAALARDVAGLAQLGYQLETVQPVDLFPHTFHVEALAVLRAQ